MEPGRGQGLPEWNWLSPWAAVGDRSVLLNGWPEPATRVAVGWSNWGGARRVRTDATWWRCLLERGTWIALPMSKGAGRDAFENDFTSHLYRQRPYGRETNEAKSHRLSPRCSRREELLLWRVDSMVKAGSELELNT